MSTRTDKRLVREAAQLTLDTLGNLLESHRNRKFTKGGKPMPRSQFCKRFNLKESLVSQIETGDVLQLKDSETRLYLAASYGSSDPRFSNSAKTVYDGLRELAILLQRLREAERETRAPLGRARTASQLALTGELEQDRRGRLTFWQMMPMATS